jgi:uncharacterized protein (DUF1330 family)
MTSEVIATGPGAPASSRHHGGPIMPSYAIAHLHSVTLGPDIAEYLARIDATLVPFHGRFLIHGARAEAMEGEWTADVIVIEFPDRASARGWYESPGYQAILPLRLNNATGVAFLVDGVPPGHSAAGLLATLSA